MATSKHVALLRGINVGGKNRVPMKQLVGLFEEAGAEDVSTYIQSGNVVFRARTSFVKKILVATERAIVSRLGVEVPLVCRSASQWRAVLERSPFLAADVDPKTLHVAFLATEPSSTQVAALDPERSPPDAFEVLGREIYIHCPKGLARTKLTNSYFDRVLGTVSTMRNWNTVRKLAEMSGE